MTPSTSHQARRRTCSTTASRTSTRCWHSSPQPARRWMPSGSPTITGNSAGPPIPKAIASSSGSPYPDVTVSGRPTDTRGAPDVAFLNRHLHRIPFMRRIAYVVGLLVCWTSVAAAQGKFPPDSFTNLKVLPKDISKPALINMMRSFTGALGVRCQYCHVGREGMPLDSFNFASDDKRTKKVARVMLHMVMHINEEHLAEVPDRPEPHVVVKCATCHRGIARPIL